DEVIVPTFTFVASFEAILDVGAVPVFADIDESLCLNPSSVAQKITSRTKAIMPVHMCGNIAELNALKQLCEQHQLWLIEDACQSIGGTYADKYVGTYGDLGCFSFDYVKTITCGEGGAVVTASQELATKLDAYQDHGHDHLGADRGADKHPIMGFNYRISELNAAVGVAQLQKFDAIFEAQHQYYALLKTTLKNIPGIQFTSIPEQAKPGAGFLNILLPDEALALKAVVALKQSGVEAFFYWYNNAWHYIKAWNHLREAALPQGLSQVQHKAIESQFEAGFSASDTVMSRCISFLTKIGHNEAQQKQRAQHIAQVLESVL
ncbi:MAG: DegT/DnrJ/EryC1/StrS family aminotransferase, partial [Flavobacteriaceae bacterium]|nr:DegT/DnrJ/EryC1/StrS family aminotransferase [Flavobacteriaceae bacterium]